MPNQKVLEQKQKLADELGSKIKDAASVVLVDYEGINVEDDTKLRSEMRGENVEYSVVKNSILSHALDAAGYSELKDLLRGTTAIAIGSDPIAPEKILKKYSDSLKKNFNFKGGVVDGKVVSVDELQELAVLPSRDGLISILAGTLNGMIARLARAVSEVAKKQDSGETAEAAAQ
ncbi:MAG: 50S ribosomal protein L10 [Oscillospiraceae bacterium]|jgi:large subunit ribosomal protein L10